LHADLLNQMQSTSGIGAKDVSIPVKEISPQALSKDMSATQAGDFVWNLTKSSMPAQVSFGDVCEADAPQPQPVTFTVKWTKLAVTAGAITAIANIYATNPAARTITTQVVDQ